MTVWLVHHAEAVGPHVDPQRPLSTRGHEQAAEIAEDIKSRGFKPQAIWHSGKLRARQTAEAMWRACNPLASFTMVRGLRPEDPPAILCDAIRRESHDLLVVGHRPNIALVFETLAERIDVDVPLNGAVELRSEDGVSWTMGESLAPRS
jgi:phosphohistidine phosphatase